MTNAAFLLGMPVVIGLALGVTLFAIYQSWQQEGTPNRRVPANRHYDNRTAEEHERRNSGTSLSGNAYRRRKSSASNSSETEQCSICLEPNTVTSKVLPCSHCFHVRCLRIWSNQGNQTCPNCRTEFTM